MPGLSQSGYGRAARRIMQETHLTLMSCPLRASWTFTIRKINIGGILNQLELLQPDLGIQGTANVPETDRNHSGKSE
jgi:hypothetical protein